MQWTGQCLLALQGNRLREHTLLGGIGGDARGNAKAPVAQMEMQLQANCCGVEPGSVGSGWPNIWKRVLRRSSLCC
jgi:hypothetical protein